MLSRTILPAFARLLTLALPAAYWYRCSRALAFVLAIFPRLLGTATGSHIFEQALFLNRLLAKLTLHGRSFPVPWCWEPGSVAAIRQALDSGRGVIFYSAHLPLVKVAFRALLETGLGPTVVIAAKPDPDGCIPVSGLGPLRLPTLQTGASVLLKTRTALKRKDSVLLLLDTTTGDYSPNILTLGGAIGATALAFTSELRPDGTVAVKFFAPPYPECRDEGQIKANLGALQAEVKRISGRTTGNPFDTVPSRRLT